MPAGVKRSGTGGFGRRRLRGGALELQLQSSSSRAPAPELQLQSSSSRAPAPELQGRAAPHRGAQAAQALCPRAQRVQSPEGRTGASSRRRPNPNPHPHPNPDPNPNPHPDPDPDPDPNPNPSQLRRCQADALASPAASPAASPTAYQTCGLALACPVDRYTGHPLRGEHVLG
jgi:hypothetical protein